MPGRARLPALPSDSCSGGPGFPRVRLGPSGVEVWMQNEISGIDAGIEQALKRTEIQLWVERPRARPDGATGGEATEAMSSRSAEGHGWAGEQRIAGRAARVVDEGGTQSVCGRREEAGGWSCHRCCSGRSACAVWTQACTSQQRAYGNINVNPANLPGAVNARAGTTPGLNAAPNQLASVGYLPIR